MALSHKRSEVCSKSPSKHSFYSPSSMKYPPDSFNMRRSLHEASERKSPPLLRDPHDHYHHHRSPSGSSQSHPSMKRTPSYEFYPHPPSSNGYNEKKPAPDFINRERHSPPNHLRHSLSPMENPHYLKKALPREREFLRETRESIPHPKLDFGKEFNQSKEKNEESISLSPIKDISPSKAPSSSAPNPNQKESLSTATISPSSPKLVVSTSTEESKTCSSCGDVSNSRACVGCNHFFCSVCALHKCANGFACDLCVTFCNLCSSSLCIGCAKKCPECKGEICETCLISEKSCPECGQSFKEPEEENEADFKCEENCEAEILMNESPKHDSQEDKNNMDETIQTNDFPPPIEENLTGSGKRKRMEESSIFEKTEYEDLTMDNKLKRIKSENSKLTLNQSGVIFDLNCDTEKSTKRSLSEHNILGVETDVITINRNPLNPTFGGDIVDEMLSNVKSSQTKKDQLIVSKTPNHMCAADVHKKQLEDKEPQIDKLSPRTVNKKIWKSSSFNRNGTNGYHNHYHPNTFRNQNHNHTATRNGFQWKH